MVQWIQEKVVDVVKLFENVNEKDRERIIIKTTCMAQYPVLWSTHLASSGIDSFKFILELAGTAGLNWARVGMRRMIITPQ